MIAHELTHVIQQGAFNPGVMGTTPIIQRDLLDDLTGAAGEAWESAKSTAGEAWESAKSTAGEAWESAKSTAGEAWESAKSTAGEVEAEYQRQKAKLIAKINNLEHALSGHSVMNLSSEEHISFNNTIAAIREKLQGKVALPNVQVMAGAASPAVAIPLIPIAIQSLEAFLAAW